MQGKRREPKLPPNRKKALELLGKTQAKGMEAFSARLFEYEMTLIELLLAELEEAEGDPQRRELSSLPSNHCPAGAFAGTWEPARHQEAAVGYIADRLRLKTALEQLLRSEGER